MKTSLGILLPLGLGSALMAQLDAPSPVGDFADGQAQWMPAWRSAHEAVWQSVGRETNALGRVVVRPNSYTELATD